jgi:hypothetical protein
VVAGVLVDGWAAAGFTAAGVDVAPVACTTVRGAATDSDLSVLFAGLLEEPEGAFAAVFSLLSGAGEFACPKETKIAAKNAIVPQVSLSVKVGMVVMRFWLMQAALKQEADQST